MCQLAQPCEWLKVAARLPVVMPVQIRLTFFAHGELQPDMIDHATYFNVQHAFPLIERLLCLVLVCSTVLLLCRGRMFVEGSLMSDVRCMIRLL